jgi:intracellular multiplication protein IcmK
MKVSGTDGRTTAYMVGDTTYVRTPLTLLSPGWSGSVSSADGMNVYSLSNAPVILLSDKGQVSRVRLSRKEIAINDK